MINGFFALIVAGIISLSPSVPDIIPERGRQEGAIHPWDAIMDNMDKSDYNGTYVKDEKLHIMAVDKLAVLRAVLISGADLDEIVIESGMMFTHQQLLNARDELFDKRTEYGINAIFINPPNNCLSVRGPEEWTDERKQKVMDAVSMYNIEFEYWDGMLDEDEEGFVPAPPPDWVKDLDWSRFDD